MSKKIPSLIFLALISLFNASSLALSQCNQKPWDYRCCLGVSPASPSYPYTPNVDFWHQYQFLNYNQSPCTPSTTCTASSPVTMDYGVNSGYMKLPDGLPTTNITCQ